MMMEWPYHFVDLDEAQKHQRRVLLDRYSNIAQLSVVLPLVAIQLCSWLSRYTRQSPSNSGRGSPHLKGARNVQSGRLARAHTSWRTFLWQCGDPLYIGEYYLGRKGEVLAAGGWLSWMLLLCVLQTGDDYLHLTKRFGIVAASQLPLHYLLAMKHPYSPIQLLTKSSHERLNAWHQLLGRIIIALLYLHAAFYLNFYVQKDLLASKLREFYVWCGIIGILSLSVIGTTALAPVRKFNYRLFYAAHVIISSCLLPILFFHVTHIRLYLYETGAVFIVNVVLRNLDTTKLTGTVNTTSDGRLVEINLPWVASAQKPNSRQWQPGQHAFLRLGGRGISEKLNTNPFSVATVPSTDGHLKFVARVLSGNTARLAREVAARKPPHQLEIEGPYGVKDHVEALLQYDRVLLVAGGVGGTFMVPIYRALLSDLSPSRGSYRRQKVTFLWMARSMSDVNWAFPEEGAERAGFVERLRVYLTGPLNVADGVANSSLSHNEDEDDFPAYAETEEGIEMEQRKELLSSHKQGNGPARTDVAELKIHPGRPDLRKAVDRTFSYGANERIAVFVCGPGGLSRTLRKEVGRWAERDIWLWEEEFSM